MAQNPQPNKGQPTGKTVIPPKAPVVAEPAESTVKEVTKQEIRWPDIKGFHGKQHSENQDDSFGTMMKRIAIVSGDDHEVIGILQKDGKQVDGVLATLQRQLLKLGLVMWFTNPSAIKARGYIRTAARYGKDMVAILGSLSEKGYHLEVTYGTKNSRLYADPKVLAQFILSVITLEKATAERWRSEEPGEEPAADEKVTEEVALVL